MPQLYAKIKKTSEYAYQNGIAKSQPERFGGFPFEVDIHADSVRGRLADHDDYCVKGGPGQQYRLADVNLFVKRSDGVAVRIS